MDGLSTSTDVEDGSVAVGAARREQVVVVGLAVRAAVALEEVPGAELLRAVRAREVLRVPRAAQRRDHLQHRQTSLASPEARTRRQIQ